MTNRAIPVRFSVTIPQKIEHKLASDLCGDLGLVKILDSISSRGDGQIENGRLLTRMF